MTSVQLNFMLGLLLLAIIATGFDLLLISAVCIGAVFGMVVQVMTTKV